MVVRGGGEAKRRDTDRQVKYNKRVIRDLVENVLAEYKRHHKNLPARIVIQKTSNFNDREKIVKRSAKKPAR